MAFAAKQSNDNKDYIPLPKNPKREKQKRARKELKRRRSGSAGVKNLFQDDSDDKDTDFYTAKSQHSRPGK